ncbi:MAG: hypothetical protein MI861_01400 [Pirellulales bacterium]|nr:hypothetical protein [Pirellulales bacterium]
MLFSEATALMLYFIPWVVLFLVCIIAIPIASMMDKRKMQAAYDGYEGSGLEGVDDDEPLEGFDDAEDGGGVLEEGSIQEGAQDPDDPFGTGAPDDFSAFEEEFK